MWLTRIAITRPIIIWAVLAAIAILGMLSYSRLPAELNPRTDIPTLTVTTVYPGAGPQEVESLVTRPLEDAVGAVNNVRNVFSSSQESVSIISMDFVVGTDLDRALNAVREKVDSARGLLPADAQSPVVAKLDINAQPVYYVGLSSSASLQQLRSVIDTRIKPELARVGGVATVTVVGGEQRVIQVAVNPVQLQRYGVTIDDVATSIKAANRSVPAGTIVQGRREIGVRTLGAFTRLEDIREAPIIAPQLMGGMPAGLGTGGMGAAAMRPAPTAPLTVGDVATVTDSTEPPPTLTRVNGRDSVGLIVTKASDANTVKVVDGVKAKLADLNNMLPPGTQMVVSRDDSIVVRDALEDVNATLILGAFLAMAVVYLFLHNLRGTIIISVALPACLVATFLVMYFADFTLNQMTLLALSLSVGILIDDSIVVLESITRHVGLGEPPEEAAFNGRTEIGFADITTTLADVVVFLPIGFMGGIVGAFFRQFGLTVVVATLFSLVVSFTVTPSLAARWYHRGEDPERVREGIFGTLERGYKRLEWYYRGVVVGAMRNRWWVVIGGGVILVAVLLFSIPTVGTDLLPAADQGQIAIAVELPPDASLTATDAVAREIEDRVLKTPDVANEATTVGEILGGFGQIPQRGPQYAQVSVRLNDKSSPFERIMALGRIPAGRRSRPDTTVEADIRRRLKDIPGARITVAAVRTAANAGPPVQLQLRGTNLDDLASAAAQIRDKLSQMPGVLDPDVSLRTGKPELQVRIDRARAGAYGVPPAQAGMILRDAVHGNTDSSFAEGGTEYPIRVQLAAAYRNEPDDLRRVTVGYSGGRAVTLGQVADFRMGAGPTGIDRINGQRMVTITANLTPNYPIGNAQTDIQKQLADIPLASLGISTHFGGETEALNENLPYFAIALGLAIILVYLVMASLFNSLLNPFIIMFTLPMALAGAIGALAITHETISLVSMIGIIMLVGLMGRNAILLIDYTGTLRARGMERDLAVEEAGATRLRPILMTTLATIFGMLPVALRIGRASEMRAPMAIVVIGGLLVSTVLTLVVIPVVYILFDDLFRRRAERAERQKSRARK